MTNIKRKKGSPIDPKKIEQAKQWAKRSNGDGSNDNDCNEQTWDVLVRDIMDLDIDKRAKNAIIRLLENRFAGQTIYVRKRDATYRERKKAIMTMVNAHFTFDEMKSVVIKRFNVTGEQAGNIIRKALWG